ncbi:MAG: hypothetical protein ACJ748_01285 [Flavisolibacter sp.]
MEKIISLLERFDKEYWKSDNLSVPITEDEFIGLQHAGLIANSIDGGLLLGESIHAVIKQGDSYILGYVEGYQYILNPLAKQELHGKFFLSNNKESFSPYEIPEGTMAIDNRPLIKDGQVYSRFILITAELALIDRYTTKANLQLLNDRNKSAYQRVMKSNSSYKNSIINFN